MNNKLLVITGPTGVGKTELCIDIATRLGIPIINADSRQMYRDMPIGTAAPTKEQLAKVRHYFVGSLSLDDYYNASMYERDVLRLLDELFADDSRSAATKDGKHLALLTGGSMMYIDSVCNGIDDIPTVNDNVRQEMKRRLADEGLEVLLEELKRLDPEYYAIVDKNNYRRVVHGLEICIQTGTTYTSYRKRTRKPRPFDVIKIMLNRPREELYERINRRVDKMMSDGFLEEAMRLYPKRGVNALNTVGYKELFSYISGVWGLEEAVERIKGNTRRYARKQLTWYKRDEQMQWFCPDDKERILDYISQQYGKVV